MTTWLQVENSLGCDACYDCQYMVELEQRHPYGEGYATETLMDCTLGRSKKDEPGDCPNIVRQPSEEEDRYAFARAIEAAVIEQCAQLVENLVIETVGNSDTPQKAVALAVIYGAKK